MTEFLLSDHDEAMLHGNFGQGPQIAMRILIRIAKIQGAEELIDISQVHIGGSIYTGPGSLAIVEQFANFGAKVRVPTTLNAISVDKRRWRDQGIDENFATKALRLADAFEEIGASPTFSCTPYALPGAPSAGEDIVWAESNAITYANSVIGARTNRHGDFLDICAAITGRAPKTNLHLTENRHGNFLVELPPLNDVDGAFFTALGYIVGQHSEGLVPVIDGLQSEPSLDDLKALCAAVSTSGPVGLVHVVGVTPEAPTRDKAFSGTKPLRSIQITEDMLVDIHRELSSGRGVPPLDSVFLGSPHFTLGDFKELSQLTDGRRCHPRVDTVIMTSRFVLEQAEANGWAQAAEHFGARISTDTCLCMLNSSIVPADTNTVMTSSGKFAHYGPGLIRQDVWYSSLRDCIDSAVCGKPVIRTPHWASGTNNEIPHKT